MRTKKLNRVILSALVLLIFLVTSCSPKVELEQSIDGEVENLNLYQNHTAGSKRLGVIAEDHSVLKHKVGVYNIQISALTKAASLPGNLDLSQNLPPVGDQGNLGSCVAWAVAYAAKSYHEKIEENWDLANSQNQFSPSWIYNQINGGQDSGSQIPDALNLVVHQGLDTLANFPYSVNDYTTQPDNTSYINASKYKATSWTYVINNANVIKQLLNDGNVVIASLSIFPDFDNLNNSSNKVYDNLNVGSSRGKHAVVLVGYDDNIQRSNGQGAFKFINSWGTDWGESGYGWLSYEFVGYHNDVVTNDAGFYAYILQDGQNQNRNIISFIKTPYHRKLVGGIVPVKVEIVSGAVSNAKLYVRKLESEQFSLIEEKIDPTEIYFNWNTLNSNNGFYEIKTVLTNTNGDESTSLIRVNLYNDAPYVAVTSPVHLGEVKDNINISINIEDIHNRNLPVDRVIILIDDAWYSHSNENQLNYSFSWNTTEVTDGTHKIKVIVEWGANLISDSIQTINVDVRNNPTSDTTVPTINILSPIQGSWAAMVKGTIQITGEANDDRTLNKIELKVVTKPYWGNSTVLKTIEVSGNKSWNVSLNTTQLANYSTYILEAKAIDKAGNESIIDTLKIYVMN